MTEIPEPTVTPIRYEVTCLPSDMDLLDRDLLSVYVERRGHDRWAVTRLSRCYDIDGEPDWEPIPSEREDEWLARYRHDFDTAISVAKKVAPTLRVNRLGVAEMLARAEADRA